MISSTKMSGDIMREHMLDTVAKFQTLRRECDKKRRKEVIMWDGLQVTAEDAVDYCDQVLGALQRYQTEVNEIIVDLGTADAAGQACLLDIVRLGDFLTNTCPKRLPAGFEPKNAGSMAMSIITAMKGQIEKLRAKGK